METLRAIVIYEINGFLAVAYVLVEHLFSLATAGALLFMIYKAPKSQASWLAAIGALAVLASLFSPAPVPFILALMCIGGQWQ